MLANLGMLTYTTWQNNTKLLRVGYVLSGILLLTYDIMVGAYVSGVSEVILLVTSAYTLYKYDYLDKIVDIVKHFYSSISRFYKINFTTNNNATLISSEIVNDVFNNFAYVENINNYAQDIKPLLKQLAQENKVQAVYFLSTNNQNLDYIYNTEKTHELLFHDVWMQLKPGLNSTYKKPLLENLTFVEAGKKQAMEIINVFSKGFLNVTGDGIYKYEDAYLKVYEERFKNEDNANLTSFLAYYNGEAIALLTAYIVGSNVHLCQITTLQNYRKKGVATALISYSIKQLRKKYGCENFYLITEKHTYLETFYLKNNFQEIAQGFCLNFGKVNKQIIKTQEDLLGGEENEEYVKITLTEYEEYLKLKKKSKKRDNA